MKYFLCIGSMLLVYLCFSQEIKYRLPVVNSFSQQAIFHNPANYSKGDLSFDGNFHSYTGDYSDVNYTYLSGLINLVPNYEKNLSTSKRAIGGLFYHDRTGDFIKQSRLYAIYQESVNITDNFWIRAGAQIGLININHSSLGFGPGGSAWNYDGAIALNFGNNNLVAGFIMQQLSNSELTPIIYTYKIERYNEVFLKFKTDIGPYATYTPEIRYQQGANNDFYYLSNTFEFHNKAGFNSTWHVKKGASFLGFYKLDQYHVFASYFVPIFSGLKEVDAMQYELGVSFKTFGGCKFKTPSEYW